MIFPHKKWTCSNLLSYVTLSETPTVVGLWWNKVTKKTIQKTKKTVQKVLHDQSKTSQFAELAALANHLQLYLWAEVNAAREE